MTPAELAQVAEWERLANEATPGPWTAIDREGGTSWFVTHGADDDALGSVWSKRHAEFIAEAREAVPELARMLREQAHVAALWEERAQSALRFAEVATAELKRIKETHSPKSVDEVFRDVKRASCKHLRCQAGSGDCIDCGTPRPVHGWQDGGGS